MRLAWRRTKRIMLLLFNNPAQRIVPYTGDCSDRLGLKMARCTQAVVLSGWNDAQLRLSKQAEEGLSGWRFRSRRLATSTFCRRTLI